MVIHSLINLHGCHLVLGESCPVFDRILLVVDDLLWYSPT